MRRASWPAGFIPLLLVTLLAGCGSEKGPELAPAAGVVTYQGAPVSKANVIYMPDGGGAAAFGMTDDDGKFSLTTGGKTGATVGSGKITVTAYQELDTPKTEEDLTAEDLEFMSQSRIPVKYSSFETSGLTANVNAKQDNDIPLELTD